MNHVDLSSEYERVDNTKVCVAGGSGELLGKPRSAVLRGEKGERRR